MADDYKNELAISPKKVAALEIVADAERYFLAFACGPASHDRLGRDGYDGFTLIDAMARANTVEMGEPVTPITRVTPSTPLGGSIKGFWSALSRTSGPLIQRFFY